MQKLVIASHNPKKLKELQEILAPHGFELLSAGDVNLPDVEETEETFIGNARLKVESGFKHTGLPCIADDSGFCVDALKGAPGVYSARYEGGPQRVLNEIKDIQTDKRTAHFMCVIAYIDKDGVFHSFEGRADGHVAEDFKGEQGFAYDPIFIPNGDNRTFAEMSAIEKHKISHRKQALDKFIQHLKKA